MVAEPGVFGCQWKYRNREGRLSPVGRLVLPRELRMVRIGVHGFVGQWLVF